MSSRTKPFSVRKGQYWASLTPNNRDGLLVLGLVIRTHGGSVTLSNVLEHPGRLASEVTISKNILLEKYKYVPKKGAELVLSQFRALISTGLETVTARIQQHASIRALRSIPTGEPDPQMELPLVLKPKKAMSRAEVKQALTDKLKGGMSVGAAKAIAQQGAGPSPCGEIPMGTSERVRLLPHWDEAQAKLKKQLEEAVKPEPHFTTSQAPGTSIMPAAQRSHLLKRKFELETELEATKIALAATWK
jgi:hypothetical protein